MTTACGRPSNVAIRALQVVQRVAVFGEDDELLVRRRRGFRSLWDASVIRRRVVGEAVRDRRRGEDLAEQRRQLAPLLVLAAAPDRVREAFQSLQRLDLDPQFLDRARGRGLVEDLFLGRFQFGVGRIVQVLDIFLVEEPATPRRIDARRPGRRAAGSPARAGGFPAVRAVGAVTGKSPPATMRGGAEGSSARSRPSRRACRFPAPRRD